MRNQIKAHIAILTANIMYGINYIAVKQILPEYASWQALAFMRAIGALVLFWIVSLFIKHEPMPKKDMWKIIVAGILGVTINQSLLVWGIGLSTPVNASIIMTLNPLFVMILSAIILKFPITKLKVFGILTGCSGALILILSSSKNEFTGTYNIGDFIILTNAIMYGLYLVWTKPLMKKYGSFTVLKYMFLFGSIPVFFYGSGPAFSISYSAIPGFVYAAIAFVVIGATFVTYMCNIIGLKYVNPTTVSIYIYLQPIIATVISIIIGQDSFSWYKLVSMLLVFAGVYLVTLTNNERTV
jgi:drug/metabolite transporter (DMT)-like permease